MEKTPDGRSVEQAKHYETRSYEELVSALEAKLEIKEESLLDISEEKGEKFENNVLTWIRAVDFVGGEKVIGKVKLNEKTTYQINFDKLELPEYVDQELSPEVALGALALTEAKLRVIGELMDDVYPALSTQAKEYLKLIESERTKFIERPTKTSAGKIARRRSLGIGPSLIVLGALIIAGCTPVNGGKVEVTPTDNDPDVELTVPALSTSTKEVLATKTPTPIPTLTATLEPTITLTPTKEVTPTVKPREFLVGALPEKIEQCKENYIRWDHLEEDMGKILEEERKISVWNPDEINLGRNKFEENLMLIYSKVSTMYINYVPTDGTRPLVKSCAYTEIKKHGVYIFTVEVPLPSNPGVVVNMHFGYDEIASKLFFEKWNVMDAYEENLSFDVTYPYMKGVPEKSFVLVEVYSGEANNNSTTSDKDKWAGIDAIKKTAEKNNYVELYTKAFLTKNPTPLTPEEIVKLEETIIPVRWFGAHPEP